MIRTEIRYNMDATDTLVSKDTTIRSILEEQRIDYSRSLVSLNSHTLTPSQLNMTLAELGFDGTPGNDRCYVACITKQDNANI